MNNKSTYSIIVPVFDGLEFYSSFFKSLEKSLDNFEFKRVEVILVSNNNKYRSKLIKIISDFKYSFLVKELDNPEKGSYSARNRGVLESQNEILIFTDIDCKLNKDYLINLDKYNLSNKIISGKIILENNNNSTIKDKNSFEFERIFFLNTDNNSKLKLGFTANTIIQRKYLDLIPFKNVNSGGDIMFYREVQEKLKLNFLYAQDIVVYHPSRTFNELKEKVLRVVSGNKENNKLKSPFTNLLLIFFNPFLLRVNWFEVKKPIPFLIISFQINFLIRIKSIKLFYGLD